VGSVHTCFRVAREDYERWRGWLAARGVAILQEVVWERGLSFYFTDPDGNLLEIANDDLWPP
jgi:catechol 2,3-dioxygenase-like lactoylglutathione lyase family enzyme